MKCANAWIAVGIQMPRFEFGTVALTASCHFTRVIVGNRRCSESLRCSSSGQIMSQTSSLSGWEPVVQIPSLASNRWQHFSA